MVNKLFSHVLCGKQFKYLVCYTHVGLIFEKKKFMAARLTLLLLLASTVVFSQEDYSASFLPPLEIPLYLAGNFAEIRSNHFHAGIDIKTQQREGLKVVAADSGYVSRIKISRYGYGKALYITHTNGFTTVYAHLQAFSPEIEEFVQRAQYAQERFEIELFPSKGELQVKRGGLIALSGNTGGSGGPHLHFEIRETATEIPLNPLKFGFEIKDDVKPILKTLAVYPMNDTSTINGSNHAKYFSVYGKGGAYTIGKQQLRGKGVLAFGIEGIDRLNGVANRCGIYEVSLFADGNQIYQHRMDKVPFHLSRYINSHVDFSSWKDRGKRVQKSFLDPGNALSIYHDVKLNGQVFFSEYGHDLRYSVRDVAGNTSQLNFSVKLDTSVSKVETQTPKGVLFAYNSSNRFVSDNIELFLPKGALYNDLFFNYEFKPSTKYLAGVHAIHNTNVPLHKYAQVKITIPSDLIKHRTKLTAISLDESGGILAAEGGKAAGEQFEFRTRSFGPYSLIADTVNPKIIQYDRINTQQSIKSQRKLRFKVTDDLSGIKSYSIYVNNKWVLAEYDSKKDLIWVDTSQLKLNNGIHSLKVVIIDAVGNEAQHAVRFLW